VSIEEHLQVISLIQGNRQYRNRLRVLSQMLELDKPHKHADILSGGNKRKLCTAMTMMTGPRLAYFDEPTVGLDPVARRSLLDLIKRSGAPVLFTTHRLDEAEYLCTRVAIMKHGRILYDGAIEDIKESFQAGAFARPNKDGSINELAQLSATCQGLVLVKEPVTDLTLKLDYLELDQQGPDQALYRVQAVCPQTNARTHLSRLFRDLNHLKSEEGGAIMRDFTYYAPSLHHAFVAINQ
jgi:ABC-type multidrug transport system ATPase subunit